MFTSFKSLHRCFGALVFVIGLFSGASVVSAQKTENAPDLDEKVSAGIAPLSALFEGKKWDEALKAIDALLAKVGPVTYDRAFLCLLKAQILGSKGELTGMIEPLEQMLKIADELKLFRFARALPVTEQDALINLASLYMQDASTSAASPDKQKAAYAKAHMYGKRLVSGAKPTVDAQSMWARILYSEATIDSKQVDLTLMKQASVEAEKALTLVIKPKEEHYMLLLATLQQLGDNKRTAEVLELLVKLFPNNKNYWPMLFNTYVAMQASGDKESDIASVVALERAQAAGQMLSNKDNFMLAGMYFNIQQPSFAADLLDKGLHSGKIDSEQRNWILLSDCYQQQGKDSKAADVLLEAINAFPASPTLENQLGQFYYTKDKREEAIKHFQAAVDKGLEKPAQTFVTIAYLYMELKRLDDAFVAAEKALKADPKLKGAQDMYDAIKESIELREKFKNQK